jgi:hypothetical protein
MSKGKAHILKLLLNVKIILEKSEPRDILNKIYTDFYSKWIQHSNDKVWSIIVEHLKRIKICKKDLKLDLDLIEEEFI